MHREINLATNHSVPIKRIATSIETK
jgi:hypothetical protein